MSNLPTDHRRAALALAGAILALAGCYAAPTASPSSEPVEQRVPLGLMTSLPLYWPQGAGLADLAAGAGEVPWQRQVIERGFDLVLLDTLTPIPALSPDAPDTDPLAGLERLAVIQPRGLSPGDNVALDNWVRGGGRLLLALDPLLTGDYDAPLGDPRRPTEAALLPPVLARWGLSLAFDPDQPAEVRSARHAGRSLPFVMAGELTAGEGADCDASGPAPILRCRVGRGEVTVIADAALFEHPELAGEDGATLLGLLRDSTAVK